MVGEAAKGAAAEGGGRSGGGTEAELVVSRWLSEEVNFLRKVEVLRGLGVGRCPWGGPGGPGGVIRY